MELADIKQQGYVWQWQQHDQAGAHYPGTLPTGYAGLDQLAGGWPQHQVTELRTPFGIGEFRLLLPYLQQQSQQGKLQVWLNAPAALYAPFLVANGLPLAQLLELNASGNEALWAAEQCLKSGCCSSVLLWQPELSIARLKRLQLAASQGQAELFLFRSARSDQLSLPVALSLQLQAAPQGLRVQLLKKRGGWPGGQHIVSFRERWPRLVQAEQHTVLTEPARQRAKG